jgi:hypothetical protein
MSDAPADKPSIVQYWHDESIPDYIAGLLRTFGEQNPELRHMVFSRERAAEFIARHFGARESAAFQACAVPAMQADYFRYCAVLALGGVYCDADVECVAPLRQLVPPAGRGRLFRGRRRNVINGVFAFGSPGHPFLELALEVATANIEVRRFDTVYYTTGPPIFMALTYMQASAPPSAFTGVGVSIQFGQVIGAYCETIGDLERVDSAFETIELVEPSAQDAFIRSPETALPYKRSATHWVDFDGPIFQ